MKRWKLAIQYFDFNILHIKGVANIEADAFSRLVHFPETDPVAAAPMEIHAMDSFHALQPDFYARIQKAHGRTSGHGGVQRTMSILAQSGSEWPFTLIYAKTSSDA